MRRFWLLVPAFVYAPHALAQTVSFVRPAEVYVGGSSRGATTCNTCVAVADFNGDGKPDILYAATEFTPFDGVLLGNGDGTFRTGTTFPLSTDLIGSPFVADFHGNGKADVIFSESETWLYSGNGDGTFAAPVQITACSSGSSPSVSAVADFNGDGKADLICGTAVLFSNGDGTFRSAGTIDANQMESVILSADFNRDGKPDLLMQQSSGALAVALGHGDGTFAADVPIATQLVVSDGILVGDFNGDGLPDIAGVDGTSPFFTALDVLPGHGDGTWGTPVRTGVLPGRLTAIGDFNKDGKLDLIAGDAVFAGNGDGTFRVPVFFGTITETCASSVVPIPCGSAHTATAVADFNGDGLTDIVAATVVQTFEDAAYSVVSVLLNDSPGDGFGATGVSSASLTWPVATGSLVSAFGVNLSSQTATASTIPFPTTLGGVRVHLWDRSTGDTLAPLLYVSPSQINYVMTSSDSFAFISVEHVGSAVPQQGLAVPVASIAPGFFSVGSGVAAASALSFGPGSAVSVVPVVSCSGASCAAVPIDLSGSPVYLSLYGTGFDAAVASQSSCNVGNQSVVPSYAGPQMQTPGLDQLNLLLPKSLAGAGTISISCTLSSDAISGFSNSVSVTIR